MRSVSRCEDRWPRAALRAAALACVLGALAGPAAASDAASTAAPLWPLEERGCVTGSFGEYRANHFHAGIDLSTGGRIGAPVRAPAAGRVVRLRASPYGYGRAIYIDLDDAERGVGGKQVVFGHLSDFAPRWRALVDAEQERLGKFTVDFAVPDSPRVAAGDVVAFSGDTGAGPPHLHFEVRDGDATAIDPLVNGWRARDETPPAVRAVRFMPLGLDGRVNGGLDPVTIQLERSKKDGVYRAAAVSATPRLGGRVGVEVLAWDATAGCDAHRGVHSAELRLDDALLFATKLDRFIYDVDVNLVNERYVYSGASGSRGRYLRLYDRVTSDGAIVVTDAATSGGAPAERALSIALADAAANRSRVALVVSFEAPAVNERALAQQRRTARPTSSTGRVLVPEVKWRLTPDATIIRVDDADVTPSRLESGELWVEIDGYRLEPLAMVGSQRWYGLPAKKTVWGALSNVSDSVALNHQGGRRITLSWRLAGTDSFSTIVDFGPFADVTASHPEFLAARCEGATLAIEKGAVAGRCLVATADALVLPVLSNGLFQRSQVARFDPVDLPLRTPVEIQFDLPADSADDSERLFICSVDPSGAVSALSTRIETKESALPRPARNQAVAKTRTLGTFALIEDLSPPRITSVRPANGKTITSKRPQLTVNVSELGKGLDDEATRFTLDGERLIPEYDPDAALIKATPKEPLSLGPHTFEVTIRDKAGHETSATSRFTVSAGATSTKKSKRGAK